MYIFNSFNDIEIYGHVYIQLEIISFPQFLLWGKAQFYGDGTIQMTATNTFSFKFLLWCFGKQNCKYSKFSKKSDIRCGIPLLAMPLASCQSP